MATLLFVILVTIIFTVLAFVGRLIGSTGGGEIPTSDLTFALRRSKLPGLHVADSWKDWVENWAGEPSMSRPISPRSLR